MESESTFPKNLIVSVEKPPPQPVILLVEDNPDDVLLLRREFERAGVTNTLHVVSRGPQAIAYLTGSGSYSDRTQYPFPELVLLDINMPGSDGLAVLRWIRRQPGFARLCVVVLSASHQTRDVDLAHHLGADLFIAKPLQHTNISELWEAMLLKQKA